VSHYNTFEKAVTLQKKAKKNMKNRVNGRLPGILADARFVQKTKENLRNFVKTTEKGEK